MTNEDWLFGISVKKYSAYYLRFQCEFDKYKTVGGRVYLYSKCSMGSYMVGYTGGNHILAALPGHFLHITSGG